MMRRLATGPASRELRRAQVAGVALILVSVPLALGGVFEGTRALMVATVAGLVAGECSMRVWTGPGPNRWERAWAIPWIVLTAIVVLQLAPLPSSLRNLVGAYPDELRWAADVPVSRLSPVPIASVAYWATFSCYWAVAWMVARFDRRQVHLLVGVLTALAVFEASYGIYAVVHESESVFGLWPRRHHVGDATGTFVNRNHFVGLLALCWPTGLAWILLDRREGGASWPEPLRQGLGILFSLIVGTAIFCGHSRVGLLAALGGITTWLVLSLPARDARVGRRLLWPYWAAPAVALAGAIWFGSARLIERFGDLPLHQQRFLVWRSLLDLPAQTWVLGAGAGSFGDVFKTVQPGRLASSFAYAHNDWLEFLCDFGFVGAGGIALALWLWWRRVRPRRLSSLQKGALAGVVAIAIHCLADFDLHVPGAALAFWILVGIVANRNLRSLGPAPRLRADRRAS